MTAALEQSLQRMHHTLPGLQLSLLASVSLPGESSRFHRAVRQRRATDPTHTHSAALKPCEPFIRRSPAESTPLQIINRFCSSGLMAVSTIANQIRNGEIEVGLAMGFEHMTAK